MVGWVEAAQGEIDAALAVPIESLHDDELPESLTEVAVLEAKAGALRLSILAEADRRELARLAAETGTDAWAAKLTGTSRSVMNGGILLAQLLRDTYDATREAFASGGVNEAQVRVIVQAAEKLPKAVTDDERRVAEEGLVAKAVNGMNPRGLRQAARRMLEVINLRLADQHESDQLEDEEEQAERETCLSLWDNADGTVSGKFTIPELHGQMLRAVLERLSSPKRLSRNKAGDLVHDDTVPGGGPGLSWTERLGAAFTEIIEHLPTTGHGPIAATLLVKLDFEDLLDGLASAGLDTGIRISAGEARRLACGAGIVPVVMGGKSEVLDWGRETRLHTRVQRRALHLVYDTCAAEGCERPFAWCDIHHPHAWSRGGETNLDNGLPLCGFHHRRAHDDQFDMRLLPSGEARFRRRR